jgi:hypothetical protein|tara:strand:+ start:3043 stop:4263 length:1221 start_codon:yes stop_codon:yes gene_type:complete
MQINAHAIFFQASGNSDFLHRLNLSDAEQARLRDARDTIRDHLQKAFREWESWLGRELLFAATTQNWLKAPALRPRFRQQGSLTYHTANRPAWTPPQEVDLDDGLFLPTEMLGEAGQSEPAVLTGGLFEIVGNALTSLCRQKDWGLKAKDTCVRVSLNHGSAAHIDVPIYAIPEKQYREIHESMAALKRDFSAQNADEIALAEEAYRQLASGEIMLAHREQGWIRSDPRKLEDWFQDAVTRHGQQVRRVCRYLKAWRDHCWKEGGPSSIALMACVVSVYDANPHRFEANRDDEALLFVASKLASLFSNPIGNPAVSGLNLDDGWDEKGLREGFVQDARDFYASLHSALIAGTHPQQVLSGLKLAFGERIPDEPGLVVFPAASPEELLESTAALAPTVKPQDKRSYA